MTTRILNVRWTTLAWLGGLAIACLLATGCSSTPSDSLSGIEQVAANPEVLRVGVTPNLPPMIFKEGGSFQGIEAEFAHGLARQLGRRPVFIEVPWENQIDALLHGKTDIIMSSMSLTTVRQARINFSRPYMRSGQIALVRRADVSKMQLFLFSEKYKVGVQKGATGEFFAQLNLPQATRVPFTDPAQGAEALIKERIDAFIHDATVNWWLSSQYETKGITVLPKLLTEEILGWGLRKQDTALLEAANAYLDKAEKDGSLNATIGKWIPNFGSR
jgi:ABC-type amino acid transport substrate-binding protein